MFSVGLGTLITWALITRWAAQDDPMPDVYPARA
jgi:hypothetical protein